MKIVTTRVQRFTFYIASLISILTAAIVFNNGYIMVGVLPVGAFMWKLVDWGQEYQERVLETKRE